MSTAPNRGRSSIGSAARSGSAAPCSRVDRKNGRCGATNVNPATGRRDLDIPGSLRAAFGHKNLGVYLIAREGGQIAVGDSMFVPRSVPAAASAAFPVPLINHAQRRFICRGCYFIYEEANGLPATIDQAGDAVCGYSRDLALPRLRHRQKHLPALRGKSGGELSETRCCRPMSCGI